MTTSARQQRGQGRPVVAANDFARQWQEIRADALQAVDEVGESGWLILGEQVTAFEEDFAAWWGVPHAIGVASGLDAIEIALRCAGVSPGDRVLSTPLTAFATTLAIIRAGAEPVWCDVDESGGLDLDLAADAIRKDPRIRAVVPVHLYGHALKAGRLQDLSGLGIAVIEDCAQSTGARRDGVVTGCAGVAGAVSLYPTKNLGAMGDGGVVITSDAEFAARARRIRNYGQAGQYEHVENGLNSRLDELQAAILRRALLPRLDGWIARRQEIAARYRAALTPGSLRPIIANGGTSSAHLFAVEVTEGEPDAVLNSLKEMGIGVSRHYPFLCPDQPAVAGNGIIVGELKVARRLAARELSLPIHPHLTDGELDRVIEACGAACP